MGAPMAGVSGAKLAFETCRAGGLGFIAAGHLNSKESFKELEHEIETFKELAAAAIASASGEESYPLCIGFIGHSTFKEELGWNLVQHLLEDYEPDGKKKMYLLIVLMYQSTRQFADCLPYIFAVFATNSYPVFRSCRFVSSTRCQGKNSRLKHCQALPIIWLQGCGAGGIGQRGHRSYGQWSRLYRGPRL
jgi:hypothetical protein